MAASQATQLKPAPFAKPLSDRVQNSGFSAAGSAEMR
jgi:hypothetical protein